VRFPIEVYPNSIIIPPHEYRHVTLVFCPKALQQYSATFEAIAVGGAADPSTASFSCEVRGEGALPSLNFQVRCGSSWVSVHHKSQGALLEHR
jgi:hydrocephalus-inducing protein